MCCSAGTGHLLLDDVVGGTSNVSWEVDSAGDLNCHTHWSQWEVIYSHWKNCKQCGPATNLFPSDGFYTSQHSHPSKMYSRTRMKNKTWGQSKQVTCGREDFAAPVVPPAQAPRLLPLLRVWLLQHHGQQATWPHRRRRCHLLLSHRWDRSASRVLPCNSGQCERHQWGDPSFDCAAGNPGARGLQFGPTHSRPQEGTDGATHREEADCQRIAQ